MFRRALPPVLFLTWGMKVMIAVIFLLACLYFLGAFRLFGRFLDRQFGIDATRATPAHTMADGIDYVVTRRPVLFGHHFSSIAGAGPIVGPILAAAYFGWGPALLWILVGAVFVGGVHDYGALVMSIRHRARSVAEICRIYLNPVTYRIFLVFIWLALVYVLVVFVDLTAAGFTAIAPDDPSQGGTVATASMIYIALAVGFGVTTRRGILSLGTASAIFVPLVFLSLIVARVIPWNPSLMPTLLHGNPKYTWSITLMVYCVAASILPVWMLLQPRDYLSSFLLYASLILGGLGLLVGGLGGQFPLQMGHFFTGWSHPKEGFIFPILFITVACGACSGFHSIVSSGTTAKQLPSEGAARTIAYGAMLVEGALAVLALATVMALGSVDLAAYGGPQGVFAAGVGRFLTVFGIPAQLGAVFGLLAVSTFLLTTLDTCMRLARYIVEEFFALKGPQWRYVSTMLTLAPMAIFSLKEFGGKPAWQVVWPAFGTTNQLMAALALLVVLVWRRSQGRAIWFVAWPMAFMLVTTCTSMVLLIRQHLILPGGTPVIGWVIAAMLAMTAVLVADTAWSWRRLGTAEPAGGLADEGASAS